MNSTLHTCLVPQAGCVDDVLASLDFSRVPGGYQRGDLRLEVGTHWCVLDAPCSGAPDDLLVGLGRPGLWKQVRVGDAQRASFALPRRVWDAALDTDAERETSVLEQCLRWALDTAEGTVPPDWQAPPRALVESWFAPDQLTVVAGVLLRQGELVCEPDRLVLRFPLVPEIPDDLTEPRRQWLRLLLEDAQDRWHLARVGFARDDEGALSVVAEVDLTGMPGELAEDLFVTGLETLRWVAQWLGEPTDWLADAAVASELLAVCPQTKP